jgi:ornithine cyclodeaminase/alanine dehydrogenase-like protein (mu-crystallin family)
VLLINNDDVRRLIRASDCIRVQEDAFAELATHRATHRPRIDVYAPAQRTDGYFRWSSMDGVTSKPGPYFASRVKSDIAYWPISDDGRVTEQKFCTRPGLYCGLVLLFSTLDGRPLAIINDGVLQHLRVGAGAALGAKYLARADASAVGILGSGGMARSYLEALIAVRPIKSAKVFSPSATNRTKFAKEMSAELQIAVTPVETAQAAVAGADIVASCTDSMTPTIAPDWITPGMHVTNVNPAEIDAACHARFDIAFRQGDANINIGPSNSARIMREVGQSPIAYVAGTEAEIERLPKPPPNRMGFGGAFPHVTDLIAATRPGRTNDEQITFYHNFGNQGLQFACVGGLVYERALKQGLGKPLPDEWFLQDVRN